MSTNVANPQAGSSVSLTGSSIPIAGFKDVYAVADVERALQGLPPSASEGLRALYDKMVRLGGQRFTVKPSTLPQMDGLREELPNFTEVLEDIRKQLALCIDSSDPVELPPVLLLGEPGIGKTHFARRIAQLLGTGFGFVPMSSLTAGWILSGASSQWKNAKPGKVFETFLNGDYANPVLVVDEIDKASAEGQYDPLGALYGLLEAETATQFVDEFAEIPIDASGAVWFATANDAARIPEPILNRMNVYQIEPPDAAGAARIALAIYREIRNAHDWGRQFPEEPGQIVLEKLAGLSPRETRRALQAAFGNAKLAGRSALAPEDADLQRGARRQRIGF
ncbi:MAG TPA: AAA family ATPase [Burkholderiales bacterium]|nr:AAA family ATPase [Burkholderiales bacterium]